MLRTPTRCRFRASWPVCAAALLAIALGCTQPARAGLDLPDYVPCFPGSGGDLSSDAADPLTVTIDTADRRQRIRNFGASDAWSIQFIGRWPMPKRAAIADLLFESGLDKANDPRGIALSAWRFNIGAGSSRQDDIEDVWRRADTFYDEDFADYDWGRLSGQRWFLQAAARRGVRQMTAFVNSPPISMTSNGKAYPDAGSGTTNLADGMEFAFARYLADILEHFRTRECIAFTEISPVNEPQWDWENGSQEGNRCSNGDIARGVEALAAQDLGGTQIEIPEAGDIRSLYEDDYRDFIDAFYDPASPDYLADVLGHTIAAHSYWSDRPPITMVRQRNDLRAKLDEYPGLEYTMSEYAILGGYGWGRDLGIAPALHIARTAHFDLTIAEASSWQWWLGVSPYDWKDGLVYTDYATDDGDFYESKMLWAVGNFSRFVRPGMVRVGLRRSDGSTPTQDATRLMVSSYFDERQNIAVVVFVNWSIQSRNVQLDVQGATIDSLIPYVTSAEDDLAAYGELTPAAVFEIPGRSIVTLVGYDSAHTFCGDGTCGADEGVESCPADCTRRGLVRPHKGHSPQPANACPQR
jgi:O-glycosyl hydrolase